MRVLVVPPAAQVALERELPDWCNPPWAQVRQLLLMIPHSMRIWALSIRPLRSRTNGLYGIPSLQLNTANVNVGYTQAFPTGTSLTFEFQNNRQTTNSPFTILSPALNSFYRFSFQQQLLAGFGLASNMRYLHIARNNKKISDIAFKDQVIATVTQIENIYWDLVGAYEEARVKEQSLQFANQTFDNAKKQLQLEAVPAIDVMKAEAEVSKRDQDLTVARTTLQLQESLMKNALTKSLDDPALEEMPVVPTDRTQPSSDETSRPILDLIAEAQRNRARTARNRYRSGQPPDQPEGRTQRLPAHALACRLLRRSGLALES